MLAMSVKVCCNGYTSYELFHSVALLALLTLELSSVLGVDSGSGGLLDTRRLKGS